MAKYFLSALFLLISFTAFSQPLHDWPDRDAFWALRYYNDNGSPSSMYKTYYLDGDTVITSQSFQALHRDSLVSAYVGALREDSLYRVWYLPKDSVSEYLLYDFSANAGDTILNAGFITPYQNGPWTRDTLHVTLVDTVNLADGPHRRILGTFGSIGMFEWYDGVGYRYDPFEPVYEPLVSGRFLLTCMIREGTTVFQQGFCNVAVGEPLFGSVSLAPNPVRDLLRIEGDTFPEDGAWEWRITGVTGGVLLHGAGVPGEIDVTALPSGLYFLSIEGPPGSLHRRFVRQD